MKGENLVELNKNRLIFESFLSYEKDRMMNVELIEKVKIHCKQLIKSSRCKNMPFHNWQHTKEVVDNCYEIAKGENTNPERTEDILIAAYFHDLGNMTIFDGHEEVSCEYARNFLEINNYPSLKIENILQIILATKMPQYPETISQKIICDADLAHLGKNDFLSKNLYLRKELEDYTNLSYTDKQWTTYNIKFLNSHTFHTPFARKYFKPQKTENIRIFKKIYNTNRS